MGNEGEPLTDTEKKLLERILGDPGNFPAAFKGWIPKHLETNPPYLPFEELAFRRPRLLAQDDATDAQAMKWSDSNGQWEPGTIDHGDISGEVALADIAQGGAATGDLLTWTGSSWDDTALTLSTDEVLKWNGSAWVGEPVNFDELSGSLGFSDLTGDATLAQIEQGGAATGDLLHWDGSAWDDTAISGLVTGDLLYWNGSDWVNFDVPAVHAYHTSNQDIANGVWLHVALPSERYDTDSMHLTSGATDNLTAKTAGVYQINGGVEVAANAGGTGRFCRIIVGSKSIAETGQFTNASFSIRLLVGAQYKLAVNDVVHMEAWQDSGGNLAVVGNAQFNPFLAMHWIGPG